MINCFIATYSNEALSIGAAKSIRQHIDVASDSLSITLINGGIKNIQNSIFDSVVNVKFPKWFGFKIAHQLCDQNNINVYIDDDIRLLSRINIREKYSMHNNEYYMPNNGYMVQIWRKIYENPNLTKKINVRRIYSTIDINSGDVYIKNLLAQNKCQIIDNIWLHIDKCSEKISPIKQELIDYLDK